MHGVAVIPYRNNGKDFLSVFLAFVADYGYEDPRKCGAFGSVCATAHCGIPLHFGTNLVLTDRKVAVKHSATITKRHVSPHKNSCKKVRNFYFL